MKFQFQNAEDKPSRFANAEIKCRGGARRYPYVGLLALSMVLSAVFQGSPSALAQLNPADSKLRATQLYNESIDLIKNGNVERAESKLVEANRLEPNDINVLNNYGMVLLKLGRLREARSALERAVAINPRFDLALLNLGLACEGLGDLAAAKVALSTYIQVTTDRERAEKMKDHVAIIEKTLAKGPVADINAPDYFGILQAEQMHPWPKERMPIKVFVASAAGIEGYKPSYGEDFQRALDMFTTALNGLVSFKMVDTESGADISLHWTHDTTNALLKAEGGDCKYTANGAGMNHANIQILTVDPSRSDRLNDYKVSWVALHELGHALGISAHSNSPDDVMYFVAPMANTMANLSQRDVRTFIRLYSEKLPDTWMTLNDGAIKMMKVGDYEGALEKLTKAIQMKPDETVLRQNLVLVEAHITDTLVAAGKYKEAEPHFINALELEQQYRDQNLKVLITNYAECLKRMGRGDEVSAMYKKYNK